MRLTASLAQTAVSLLSLSPCSLLVGIAPISRVCSGAVPNSCPYPEAPAPA